VSKTYDELNSSYQDLYDELLLTAQNEGAFYPDDPKGAIQHAFDTYVKYQNENMQESFREMRWTLLGELKELWDGE